jgi:hypothetical protein
MQIHKRTFIIEILHYLRFEGENNHFIEFIQIDLILKLLPKNVIIVVRNEIKFERN